mmetsp:Transcript_19829/g.51903  ORF Transcript_19829/g.51903 Transcript_19829/m.51903 type:complete len:461 (-) Transcript_19829:35-1417(-)
MPGQRLRLALAAIFAGARAQWHIYHSDRSADSVCALWLEYVLARAFPNVTGSACVSSSNGHRDDCRRAPPTNFSVFFEKEPADGPSMKKRADAHDLVVTSLASTRTPRAVYVPWAALSFVSRTQPPAALLRPAGAPAEARTKAVLYLNKHRVWYRENFVRDLRDGNIPVVSRDDLLRNGTLSDVRAANVKTEDGRQLFFDEAVEVAARFDVLLAFENAVKPGWVTEKIVNGFLAGTVPAYRGTDDVFRFFNREAFIHCASAGTRCEAAIRRALADGDALRRLREAPPVTAEGYARLFPWHDTVADEAWYANVRRILTTPREVRAKRADGGSCARPTPDDALLQAWQDALADLPEDMCERPREKRRARRTPNKRRQDICPRVAPDDALLQAWRDALTKKSEGEGVCKNRRGKSTARIAQEKIHQKFGRVALADKRRHADRIAAKANLYARGARIRDSAKGR